MGGCRCTFQHCENGTALRKDLHYFRYPVRDPARLKVWIRNANRKEYCDLPDDKLSNKVVCQQHFERVMFMNELRERLTKIAIPRLMPRQDDSLLNVETGELYVEADSTEENVIAAPKQSSPVQNKITKKIERNVVKTSPEEPVLKKIKILNSQSPIVNRDDVPCEVIRIKPPASSRLPMSRRKVAHGNAKTPQQQQQQQLKVMPIKGIDFNSLDNRNSTDTLLDPDVIAIDEVFLQEVDQTAEDPEPMAPSVGNQQSVQMNSCSGIVSLTPAPPVTVPVIDPAVLEKLEQNGREIVRLQKLVKQLADRPQPESAVVSSAVPPKIVMEKGPQLTKAQLFNSIKRYLNPTMITLLRMELFAGASERQWKSDEKSLAVEIFNMGEQVYDCFQDEFRFRLPPKSEVKEWKDSGEIDADDAC
uniref:THAP-type domain-containing protein n=1 Tax=Anopheles dirus TaxID=7168 RepID=A0A182NCS5_9DIPT